MIGFIIGLFVGAFIGVVFMCLCNAAAKADEQMKDHINDKNKKGTSVPAGITIHHVEYNKEYVMTEI